MSRNLLKELRHCARVGDKEKTASILRALLEQEPNDCFALAEWQRLEAGKALYSTLDYKSYRRILHEAAHETLDRLMQRYPLSGVERMVKGTIRKILAAFSLMERRMQDRQTLTPGMLEYKKALRRELRKRGLLAGGRSTVLIGILLIFPLLAGAGVWHMRSRAKISAHALEKAIAAEDWQRVVTLKDVAGSGINKLLYPPAEASLNKAEAWITHKKAIHREAQRIILSLQKGQSNIETMPLSQRALMERYLRAMPKELNDLSPAWDNYRLQAKQQWLQQLPGILAKLHEPLPAMPQWSGRESDIPSAACYNQTLSDLLREYEDAVDAYHLDADLLSPLKERLDSVKKLRQELTTWQRTIKGLPTAKNYQDYLFALRNIASLTNYPPARELVSAMRYFPTEDTVTNRMRDPEGKVPDAQVNVMHNILLNRGATFCQEGAASPRQIELLDDLFTTRTLRTKLYRISSAQGMHAYSETAYTTGGDGIITFRRSELDPSFRLEASNKETWSAAGIRQQVIDPSGLVSAAGLERRTFFIRTNLPAAMSAVLNYTHKGCPALAKAYVYDILLRVLQMHEYPAFIGGQYSPSLKKDIRSFTRMKQALGIELKAGCWLQPTTQAAKAEALAAAWFNKRQGRDYAAEIKKNYSSVVAIHPVYIGYVGQDGQGVLCRPLRKGDELWYQGRNGLGNDLRPDVAYAQAVPFSPLFVKAKGKKKER